VHTALFMIDSGAGGADIMFHSRATRELGLVPSKASHKTRCALLGVPGCLPGCAAGATWDGMRTPFKGGWLGAAGLARDLPVVAGGAADPQLS
jgi:hypothetical protein